MGREDQHAELLRIGVGGVIPVRWDLAKSEDGLGTLTGWASVYGAVDLQDDIVMPGAFKKWLSRWRTAKSVVPLTFDHENNARGVIGSLTDVVDKPYGLRATFTFASTQDAQDARAKAREGHLAGLSIFGAITNKSVEMVDDRAVRILREIDPLVSVGLTPMPANQKALVTAVKDPAGKVNVPDVDPLPEPWVSDMRHAITLTNATARALAVKTLITDLASTVAADADHDDDANNEGSTAEPETNDDKAASLYALSLIGESEPEGSPAGGPADLDDLLAQVNVGETSAQIDALAKELGATQ